MLSRKSVTPDFLDILTTNISEMLRPIRNNEYTIQKDLRLEKGSPFSTAENTLLDIIELFLKQKLFEWVDKKLIITLISRSDAYNKNGKEHRQSALNKEDLHTLFDKPLRIGDQKRLNGLMPSRIQGSSRLTHFIHAKQPCNSYYFSLIGSSWVTAISCRSKP